MSRRTSESNKAIREAWSNEKKLVQEGKATREWTPEQQQDILDKGKAYDEDGRAFEGQHMMSAEKYPEYQGNPENIQFLTRDEHLEAHDGNWKNPTSWYFNPITKEKIDFSNGNFKPCEVIDLYAPVIRTEVEEVVKVKIPQEIMTEKLKKIAQDKPSKTVQKTNSSVNTEHKVEFVQHMKNALKSGVEKTVNFTNKHPTATKAIKRIIGGAFITVVAVTISESLKKGSSDSEYGQSDDDCSKNETTENEEYSVLEDSSQSTERSSPGEHNVRGHGQHYNTKEGRVWKEKDSYPRGGKKDE